LDSLSREIASNKAGDESLDVTIPRRLAKVAKRSGSRALLFEQ